MALDQLMRLALAGELSGGGINVPMPKRVVVPPIPRPRPRYVPGSPSEDPVEAAVPAPGSLPVDRAAPRRSGSRIRDVLTAAAQGAISVPSTAGIVQSVMGGFAGAQGYKRAQESLAADDAIRAEDRTYRRERDSIRDAIAAEEREYERERQLIEDEREDRDYRRERKQDKRKAKQDERKWELEERKLLAEIAKATDPSLTRQELLSIERLVAEKAKALGLHSSATMGKKERNKRLEELEEYQEGLIRRIRGDKGLPEDPEDDAAPSTVTSDPPTDTTPRAATPSTTPGAPRVRAVNSETGETVEWDGRNWVPVE